MKTGNVLSGVMQKKFIKGRRLESVGSVDNVFVFYFSANCIRYSNFTVWKNWDFGVYISQIPSSILSNIMSADNGAGIFTMVIGPNALGHNKVDKTSRIQDSVVIGISDAFDCTNDIVNPSDMNYVLSYESRCDNLKMEGIIFTTFVSSVYTDSETAYCHSLGYHAIGGQSFIDGW